MAFTLGSYEKSLKSLRNLESVVRFLSKRMEIIMPCQVKILDRAYRYGMINWQLIKEIIWL